MKVLLPWLCVVGLVIGLGWVYSAGQKRNAELAALREESQHLQKLRAELEESQNARAQAESDELARLRRDREELLRLRNEVGLLRKEKQQLSTQVQTVQAQAQSAQQQVQALRASPAQAMAAAQAAAAARQGQPAPTSEQAQALACMSYLRLIDGAKQQWALERQKPAGALLTATDLMPYLKSNAVPVCPAGGVYTLNPVGLAPICNIPGHTLAK